jgi:hypothetical protein
MDNDAVFSVTIASINPASIASPATTKTSCVYLCDGWWLSSRPTGLNRCLNKALCVIFSLCHLNEAMNQNIELLLEDFQRDFAQLIVLAI